MSRKKGEITNRMFNEPEYHRTIIKKTLHKKMYSWTKIEYNKYSVKIL